MHGEDHENYKLIKKTFTNRSIQELQKLAQQIAAEHENSYRIC